MIGNRLKELRIKNNKTQQQIAAFLNMSYVAYGDYEREKAEPNNDTLIKLADYFGVSIDYILKGDEQGKKEITFTKEEVDKLIDVINILDAKIK